MATSKQDIPAVIKPSRKIALVSGCTMKEYDQQISDLKKENFSLKLRIYYTEERLKQTFGDDQDVLKMNVQLQTEIDSLKQELIDKQVLIQKAAIAIETLTADREKDEETIKNRLRADCEKELTQLHDQLDKANQSSDLSHREVDKARKEVEMLKQQLSDTTRDLAASNKTNEGLGNTLEEMKLKLKEKDTLLNRYKKSVEGLMKLLHQKNEECENLTVKVDEGSEEIQSLETELKESKLQNSNVHGLSLKQLHDVKLLMDFLHEEMKFLVFFSQQLKDNTGDDTNIKAWLTETSSVQTVYQKLQEVVGKIRHLDQILMFSVHARQGHGDRLENGSHHGHNMPELVFQIPGHDELSGPQSEEQSQQRSLQETVAETGTSSSQSRAVFSTGNSSGRPPASYSAVDEVNTDDIDSLSQSDMILSKINWCLQMPARVEGEGQEKLIKVSESIDLNQAKKPQPDLKQKAEIKMSSDDPLKDFGTDNPEIKMSGADTVENLEMSNLKVVSSVEMSKDLRRGNEEIMNISNLDSVEDLRDNQTDDLRTTELNNNVMENPIASPRCSNSLIADSKEEPFGTYSENLGNFHKFRHDAFFEEDHFDFRWHDQASSVKFDSQNATSTGRTVSEQITPSHISQWRTGDINSSRCLSDKCSLSHAEEAQNIRQNTQSPTDVHQNILGTQLTDVGPNIPGSQSTDVGQNILGSQLTDDGQNILGSQSTDVGQNILGSQSTDVGQNILCSQLTDVGQNILDNQLTDVGQQPGAVDQNIFDSQQPTDIDQNTFDSQQSTDVGQNILGIQQPTYMGQDILDSRQPIVVGQNILGSQQPTDIYESVLGNQIKDLEEKLKATENTVKLLSRKNKIYLSALKAAGVCVKFMNRSNSESCLGSLSASTDKRASSVGSLSMLTPGRNNNSIERPRSFMCDTFNQTGDMTFGSVAASIVASPSLMAVSLADDAARISEMRADIFNLSAQSCTSNLNHAVSRSNSTLVNDHVSDANSNNHNTSCVGNVSPSIWIFPASPPASLTGSMRTSPHKDPRDISHSPEGHHHTTPISKCLSRISCHDHTSMDPHVKTGKGESIVKPSLNVIGVSQNGHPEVTYSSFVDSSWMNHRASLDGNTVSQSRHPDVTFSSILHNTLANHGVKSNIDMSGVSQGRSPDVTFSSIMDGSLMNRLLNNLEHSLSALRDDTWNISDLSVGQLRNHVEHLERVNLALKEEIRVYETLHCLQTSQVHLNNKPSGPNKGGQELSEENLLESYNKSKTSQLLSEEDLLRQYLIEIKKIRRRLESLDLMKDPDQLLIFQSHTHQRIVHQETVIGHLQQLMVEKETQWQQEISELQHKLSREKVLAVVQLESTISKLQTTVRDQAEEIKEQEKQIDDLKLCLEQGERNNKYKEEGTMKGGKCDLEAHLLNINAICCDESQRLDDKLEAKQKEVEKLKMELETEQESWKFLREIIVKQEMSLQEKILDLQKLTSEKALVEDIVKEKEAEVRKLELELGDLREQLQEVKVALEERTVLVDNVELLKEALWERENEEVRYDFQKMRYAAEIEKITEEKVKLSMDLEAESREKEGLKLRLRELEHKVLEQVKLERQNSELKGEIKSLLSEVVKLNTKLGHRVAQEMDMRNRLRMLGEFKSQVSTLREQLLKCEDSLKVAEQLRDSALDEVKEREERLKKRNQQLQHLLQQYKKLEAAFIKQKSKLKEKTDLLQHLKKQIRPHEPNLTCSSDHSLNETNLSLNSENYPDAAFTSTPSSSPPVKQHSDSVSHRQCRRQLTYSAVETQPLEDSLLTTGSDTCGPVAILTRGCHDKLHKKTEECLLILTEIESRLGRRLGVYKAEDKSENKEVGILRETYASCQRLDNCLRETAGWIAAAWFTELPDSKIKNGDPESELKQQPSHGTTPQSLAEQQHKPHKHHKPWENTLYKQLCKTTKDLEQVKENMASSVTSLPPF